MNKNDFILYSTGCPKCKVLKNKLSDHNVEFIEINDKNIMVEKGIVAVPMLEVNGDMFDFANAVRLINEMEDK